MPLIAETLQKANSFRKQFGIEQNKTWDDMASNALVLRENGVTLEFTAMNGTAVVKQADVIMLTYPLSYGTNYSAQDALNDLDYVSLPMLQSSSLATSNAMLTSSACSMPTSSHPTDRP